MFIQLLKTICLNRDLYVEGSILKIEKSHGQELVDQETAVETEIDEDTDDYTELP